MRWNLAPGQACRLMQNRLGGSRWCREDNCHLSFKQIHKAGVTNLRLGVEVKWSTNIKTANIKWGFRISTCVWAWVNSQVPMCHLSHFLTESLHRYRPDHFWIKCKVQSMQRHKMATVDMESPGNAIWRRHCWDSCLCQHSTTCPSGEHLWEPLLLALCFPMIRSLPKHAKM